MGILANLTDEIKNAMRAKDSLRLEALRAIKSAVMLEQTSSATGTTLTDEQEIKLVQKLVKQRKDSAQIFKDQNRPDLVEPEEAQAGSQAQVGGQRGQAQDRDQEEEEGPRRAEGQAHRVHVLQRGEPRRHEVAAPGGGREGYLDAARQRLEPPGR